MLAKWLKRGLAALAVLLIAAAAVYALLPQPVPVDVAKVDRGPLEVTIDEEGVARIRDVFVVSAPVAGRVERLPVEVGDAVVKDDTVLAVIHPAEPAFLDARSRREAEASVEAARAAVTLAGAQLDAATAAERLAESDLDRAMRLAKVGTISESTFEKISADVDTTRAQVEQAKATLNLRRSELASAEARLIEPDQTVGAASGACCVTVKAPADGTVLKLRTESEQVVAPGAGLLEIGDQQNKEIVVHLLSSDAVAIAPGAKARITDWGGKGELSAAVRRIDPAAYTKVSALGIEEQRVDALLDILDPYATWKTLGHEFRVMVHILAWQGSDVLRVPLGALFRKGSEWAVFKVVDGRAETVTVAVGHRNLVTAEILSGLAPGDTIVLHPSDQVSDGVAVALRAGG
jgi:HlyD family secretion protein